MNDIYQTKILELFEQWSGLPAKELEPLAASGSDRHYFRITGGGQTVLGAYNPTVKENIAFIEFSKRFRKQNLPVPDIYAVATDQNSYLLEDLGHTSLYNLLSAQRTGEDISQNIIELYKQSIEYLVKFQTQGAKILDFSLCYPRHRFDKQSMLWDLNYFKYYFLKLADIPFDEQLLEDDFQAFTDYLQKTDCNYFMYRDFQSRNIMVTQSGPAFIDYQGGRRGALQYDLASLLFDAKADLPENLRTELLEYYITKIKATENIDEEEFRKFYYAYVYIRIMQAMGAYGFRGFYQKKTHFLKSIPYAINNMKHLLKHHPLPEQFSTLNNVLKHITESEKLQSINEQDTLTVTINSFSYRRSIPVDYSGNGGGFVFDCRCIHNPGRYEEYKDKTGRDPEVINFLENGEEANNYLKHVFALADQSVNKYISRGFKHLMFSFGCTGGQHRSVYCADRLAGYLQNFPVKIHIKHQEMEFAGRFQPQKQEKL